MPDQPEPRYEHGMIRYSNAEFPRRKRRRVVTDVPETGGRDDVVATFEPGLGNSVPVGRDRVHPLGALWWHRLKEHKALVAAFFIWFAVTALIYWALFHMRFYS